MSMLDRLLQSLVAAAAAPLFTPDRALPRPSAAFGWTGAGAIGGADAGFAVEAVEIGMTVIALSRAAAEHSPRPEVGEFAQALIAEYIAANAELARLAAEKRLTLPLAAGVPARAQADELAAMGSDNLDSAYLRRMAEEQDRAAALFRRHRDSGGDGGIAGFVDARLPVIEHHLRQARDLMEDKSSKNGRKSHRKGG